MTGIKTILPRIPFLRFLMPFILGIILSNHFISSSNTLIFISVLSLCLFFLYYGYQIKSFQYRWIFGIFTGIVFLLLGIGITDIRKESPPKLPDSDNSFFYLVSVIDEPQEKKNSIKIPVRIHRLRKDTSWKKFNAKAVLYFEKKQMLLNLKYADCMLIKSELEEIKNYGNPHEFDYQRYMNINGYYYQGYVKDDSWCLADIKIPCNRIIAFAKKIRKQLLGLYREYDISGQEFAVLSALTLGYKQTLDRETKQKYSASGAMHILAVSGLHVGIIYYIFSLVLGFLNHSFYKRILKTILLIGIIWLFAFISGFSPSVFRASIMFSVFIIGELSSRKYQVYNIIAVAAFIMLFYDPNLLHHVGFQLSFFAVTSIVYFQPKIESLWKPPDKITKFIWLIVSVSIAAQIGTAPLGLFYFNQFSNFFIFTNIAVIPLATLILVLAVILFSVSLFPFLAGIVAFILKQVVYIMNKIVFGIESIPYSTMSEIYLHQREILLLFALIGLTGLYIVYRKPKVLLFAFMFFLLIISSLTYRNYKRSKQQEFIVYNVANKSFYNIVNGFDSYILTTYNDKESIEKMKYAASNYQIVKGAKIFETFINPDKAFKNQHFAGKKNIIVLSDKIIALVDGNFPVIATQPGKDTLDCVIFRGNPKKTFTKVLDTFHTKKVVCDPSVPYWLTPKIELFCEKQGIPCHIVSEDGAFILKIS